MWKVAVNGRTPATIWPGDCASLTAIPAMPTWSRCNTDALADPW
jgi:hypothetical protein